MNIDDIRKIYEEEFNNPVDPNLPKRMARVDDMSPQVYAVFMHPDYLKYNPKVTALAQEICDSIKRRTEEAQDGNKWTS